MRADVRSVRIMGPDETVRTLAVSEDLYRSGVEGMIHAELDYAYDPVLLPNSGDQGKGMWRYRRLLPLDEGAIRYPLHVGGTPLVAPEGLRRHLGLMSLFIKDETRGPSSSNKDRASALVVETALRAGVGTVSCASTGNVATSLAVAAAAGGLRAVVFVPADVAPTKLQVMRAVGATVLKVKEGYEAAFRLSREAAQAFGWFDRNTGVNPLTVEAKKTAAFEIYEQLGAFPDVVVAPVGDGPTLRALYKGFAELAACGVPGKLPRIVGVQAEGCSPIAGAWHTGVLKDAAPATIADGIAVAAPVSVGAVLDALRATGGTMVTVSDEQILDGVGLYAQKAGLLAEPAGACALAGCRRAVELGLIAAQERVVVLLTGSGLKTPQFFAAPGQVHEISANLDALSTVLAM